MSKKVNPNLESTVKILDIVGTPGGNAAVVALALNGVFVKFTKTSGKIMKRTGKGLGRRDGCSGEAKLAAPASSLGYYRYDQLTAPKPTFHRPAGIVAE